jgi:hypothetical protein
MARLVPLALFGLGLLFVAASLATRVFVFKEAITFERVVHSVVLATMVVAGTWWFLKSNYRDAG